MRITRNQCPACQGQLTYGPLTNDLSNLDGEMKCAACGTRYRWGYRWSIWRALIFLGTPAAAGLLYAAIVGNNNADSWWYWFGLIVVVMLALRIARLSMRTLVADTSD